MVGRRAQTERFPGHEPKRISSRSFFFVRNLLLCKRKNHPCRWFFRWAENPGRFSNRGHWVYQGAITKTALPVQLYSSHNFRTSLVLLVASPCYQWLLPLAPCRALPGWTQDDSYRNGRCKRHLRALSRTCRWMHRRCLCEKDFVRFSFSGGRQSFASHRVPPGRSGIQ